MRDHVVDPYTEAVRESAGKTPDPRLSDPMAEGPRSARAFDNSFDHGAEIERLDRLARMLDAKFGIPGTRFSFGYDAIIGLIPGIGDALTLAPQAWLIWRARELGAPKSLMAKMAVNTGMDTLLGAIPLVGDLFDVAFKANLRNVRLLRDHLEREAVRSERRAA